MPAPRTLKLLREWSPTLSVGILTAISMSLAPEISLLERVGVKLVHLGVMDGCFAPVVTLGPPLVKAVRTPLLNRDYRHG